MEQAYIAIDWVNDNLRVLYGDMLWQAVVDRMARVSEDKETVRAVAAEKSEKGSYAILGPIDAEFPGFEA